MIKNINKKKREIINDKSNAKQISSKWYNQCLKINRKLNVSPAINFIVKV